jgi:hypothetical protein
MTSTELGRVSVRREGNQVILLLDVPVPERLTTPAPSPPIEAIRFDREEAGLALRVQVAPEVPYSIRREGSRLTVFFGQPEDARPAPRESELDQLYRGLFPASSVALSDTADLVPPGGEPGPAGEPVDGVQLGSLTLMPMVIASYVDSDSALIESPQPVRDRYFQIEPKLAAELPILQGKLTADYAPRLRQGSGLPLVEQPSHFVNAAFERGESNALRIGEHYSHGVLETYEVDPGGEYFFDLGVFSRNTVDGNLRWSRGGRLGLELSGGYTTVNVDEQSSFYDYDSWWGQ